jgi:tRNA pseudouridine32 synthase / 23S rRNA pseudouridine746 synthase
MTIENWAAIREDRVVLENEAILVLNKPAGISVTGERHDTDVVRLAAESGEELIPVHRIDKVTSGAVLMAKSIEVHGGLTRQFNRRTVDKAYLAITRSRGLPPQGVIDLPLSVGRKNRVRIAARREAIALDEATGRWSVPQSKIRTDHKTYPSVSTFARVWEGGEHTVLLVRPITGRRHQIRVHLAWIGHPIEGDPLFGGTSRTFLHSWHLAFDASWSDDRRICVDAEPDDDFWQPIGRAMPADGVEAIVNRARGALSTLGEIVHTS